MRFDWPGFLRSRGIHFVTAGPNTARGNISIQCPWCGPADHSEHLGISLEGRGWSCWRNSEHRGIRPHRLIMALLGCSYMDAAKLVGDGDAVMPTLDDRNFGDHIAALVSGAAPASKKPRTLDFPTEVKLLWHRPLGYHTFHGYLLARGYEEQEVRRLMFQYNLRGCVRGAYRYRLVFPVLHPEGLVCWTGRTVITTEELRYKALSADEEKAKKEQTPQARLPIHSCLWQASELWESGGTALVICEGPFDAMRVDFLGRDRDIRATCVFGKHISDDQIALLVDIAPKFKHHVLLLDPDAFFDAQGLVAALEPLGFRTRSLPRGVKDPAELRPEHGLGFLFN